MNNEIDNSILFFRIWKNIYLNNEIFNHIRLMKENRILAIKKLDELKESKNKLILGYVEKLECTGKYKEFRNGDLPENGVLRTIVYRYNNRISGKFNNIPKSVKCLENVFLDQIDLDNGVNVFNSIKDHIESVSFVQGFNGRITNNTFPKQLKLKKLVLDFGWNNGGSKLEIGDLPNGLEILKLSSYTVDSLSTGVIPDTVTDLDISTPANSVLEIGVVPSLVKKLNILCMEKGLTIPVGAIPDSCLKLVISVRGLSILPGSLGRNLTTLDIYGNLDTAEFSEGILPNSLLSFKLYSSNSPILHGALPDSLTELDYSPNPLDDNYVQNNQRLKVGELKTGFFPSSITNLSIGRISTEDHPIFPGFIPDTVKTLHFTNSFNQDVVKGVIPTSVTDLTFGSDYNHGIELGALHSSIINLHFSQTGFNDNQIEIGFLPCNLKKLVFTFYSQPIIVGSLPSSITYLEFGFSYSHPLSIDMLPSSLETLVVRPLLNSLLSYDLLTHIKEKNIKLIKIKDLC